MTLPETSTPLVAAAIVGGIGLLGIVAGLMACRQVFAEGRTLDQGEDKLAVAISSTDLDSADPTTWLASNDLPKDSHFGDHLLSVWCGWLGERVPTLAELHSLSARRERRRLSARISGGITALLLVCGIAGTLLCIHPILQAFTIPVNANNEVRIDPLVAQKLIRSLGSAFLPSLTALAFTVVVAIFRGIYLQSTTGLAWRLDRFAVAQLFPMFKPKRFGSELTEVHLKLSRLVDRLEERDEKFGEGVETFGQAAIDIKEAGPKLKAASDRITNAADRLASETETMTKALENCLGEDSPLVRANTSLKDILDACQETAKELRKGSTALATSVAGMSSKFEESRTQLDTLIADIPSKIQQGCNAGNKALLDAAGTLEQANARLSIEVAGIPSNIEDGCNLGIKALTEVNQKAANGAADTIVRAAESATAGIKSAVSNAQKDIQKSCVDAGEDYKSKAKDASIQAAAVFREASIAAAKIIKDEVDPIKQVTAEMRKKLTDTIESVANGGKARPPVATLKRKLWKRVLSLGILK